MRKKLIFAGVWWLFIFFLIAVVTLFSGSVYGVAAIIIWTFLPVLTWGINLFAPKKLQVDMKVTATAFKEDEIKGQIILKNLLRLATGNALCQLAISNTLTGEKQTKIVEIPLSGKKENEEDFMLISKYCGYFPIRQRIMT